MTKESSSHTKGPFRSEKIEDALKTWESGGLVAIPTETVFGLGAPVHNEELIKKVFSYKERPFFDPLIVHVSSVEMAKNYVLESHWNEICEILAKTFWPGPLTLILKKAPEVSDLITSGLDTVGIRIPGSKKTRELISKLGQGVAAPSANKFTKTSPTHPDHVERAFKDHFLCLLTDTEEYQERERTSKNVGIESTILQVEGNVLRLLRPGAITPYDIERALEGQTYQWVAGKTAFDREAEKMTAPGQFPAHYRPDYPLWLCEKDELTSFFNWREEQGENRDQAQVEFLEKDPFVTARQLYFLIQKPLPEDKSFKVFVLPHGRGDKDDRQKQMWVSVFNRLEKAAQTYQK